MKTVWPYLRIAAALLALTALSRQLTREIATAQAATTEWGRDIPTAVGNFFSFFTTLSGVIAAVALLIGGAWMLRTKKNDVEPRWLAMLLAYASTYMITTGIVYNLLLRGIPSHSASEQWTSETLHVVLPMVMLLDVLFAPRRRALGWGTAVLAVVFPLAWGGYTLLRGPFITDPFTATPYWYPYPFLNPHTSSWLSVGIYIAVIAVGILGLAAVVVWIGRLRGARRRH